MKFQSLYTNTSNPKAIAGLLLVTVAVAYCQSHADQIVDGAVSIVKDCPRKAEQLLHYGKRKYHVCKQDFDGNVVDTGKVVWK
jgi:hypothetical protein